MLTINVGSRRIGTKGEYVGRGNVLGNPYRLESGEEAGSTLKAYKTWLWGQIQREDTAVCSELERLLGLAREENGVTLVCWCKKAVNDDCPCHADVLKACLTWMDSQGPTATLSEDDPRTNEKLAEALKRRASQLHRHHQEWQALFSQGRRWV